jgi:hypothetical protein
MTNKILRELKILLHLKIQIQRNKRGSRLINQQAHNNKPQSKEMGK